ncbi:hypothetical protein L1280_001946 [Deinococcus sp. HSC-46F16]|uniref:AIPR family protein n=1 Tax=Deinococcus sp. HSC-46F16 TaxID=2910968 RepID=UPI00209EE8F3|nr:AIPR family protein [Deinococcus sp. HSC-46F16]MCP2014794.1 hypothetical protein [Deinococcus sp. HSC-46F16]
MKDEERARVEAALTRRFLDTNLIPDLPDEPEEPVKSAEEKRKNRLSKALAAYTVAGLCCLSDNDSIGCLVDGEEDNGIDAIHIQGDTVYLIQAKYKRGEPDRDDDIHPFVKGARDLLDGHYNDFRNPLFLDRQTEIDQAMTAPGLKLVLVFVHMGEIVKDHALQLLTDFCRQTGSTFHDINGQLIHMALLTDERRPEIEARLTLHHHRLMETAPRVAFGLIHVRQLAELFHEYGPLLFDQNIRSFLGRNSLNRDIETSLRTTPELFVHYNNGITMTCTHLEAPRGQRTQGNYRVQRLSIVNGAQTVGSIAQAVPPGDPNPPEAYVMVTLIETQDAGATFAVDVTRARNTQNPIPAEAFAAQDVTHEHLRQKLAMQGIQYVYKPGRDRREAHCTLEDVANTLAMFSADPTDALTRDVSELLKVGSPAYQRLFGTNLRRLEPERLYRMVQVFQQVERTLAEYRRTAPSRSLERLFYSRMRPLIRCWIAKRSRVVKGNSALLLSNAEAGTVSQDIERYAGQVLQATLAYSDANSRGVTAISNSLADCRTILSNLEDQWREEQRAAAQRAEAQRN